VVVTGNCKVAYEEPFQTGVDQNGAPIPGVIQRFNPGRVRILPLNSSYCFPEWHPHDRDRLLRFKQKYRFWGCHDLQTEALTRDGWKRHDQIKVGDELLTLNPVTDAATWQAATAVNVYDYDGEMVQWSGRVDALTTPNHRWIGQDRHGQRGMVYSEFVRELPKDAHLVVGGGTPLGFRDTAKWSDELVESVAWYVCDGADHVNQTGYRSIHLSGKKPHKLAAWRRLAAHWTAQGATWREGKTRTDNGQATFYLGKGVAAALQEAAPGKAITPEFLCSLTYAQAVLFHQTLLAADGHARRGSARWTQIDQGRKDAYQMLCAMLGVRSNQHDPQKVQEYASGTVTPQGLREERVDYDGQVWCPTVPAGHFMARRNGVTFWTGNTSAEGTRSVFTFTELLTESFIEEYINDQLVDSRPNPLGTIPIGHAPNMMVSGSPWGMSDISDILTLNREYNEKATDVSDIVNYHAAPVTVMTGAKSSQLERGAKKIWGGLPKDASVFNLELAGGGVAAGLEYMEMVKKAMHELTGVPQGALGDVQPISNTSGVALAIQYQPMMQRYNHKKMTYGKLFKRVNELVILTLALKEPLELQWTSTRDAELQPYQKPMLDIDDPISFVTVIHWPPPLPVDKTVILNEVGLKMQMGLVSKKDALEELGEVFPEEKMRETFLEMVQDAIDSGALDMVRAQISALIQAETGQFMPGAPQPFPAPVAGMGSADGETTEMSTGTPGDSTGGLASGGIGMGMQLTPETGDLLNRLNQRAYGTQLAGRRPPASDTDNTT
jgi:hypothetical protein